MRKLEVGGLGIKDLLTYAMEMKALMTPTIAPDHASKSSERLSHQECLDLRLFQTAHQASHFKTGCHGNPVYCPKPNERLVPTLRMAEGNWVV